MTLQDLTTMQLDRLYRRLYERVERTFDDGAGKFCGLAFGVDFRTLRLTRPGLARDLERVLAELQARGE